MKKGISTAALVSALLLGNTLAHAQAGLKKADRQYEQWAYVDALDIYEKVEKRGFSSKELHENLGNANYFNARYAQAQKQYERLFTEYGNEDIAPEYYYRYAQTLQHVGDDAQAKSYYNQFVAKVGSQAQIAKIRASEAELKQQIVQNSGRYDRLANLSINTPFADYGSYVNNNRLYFTSAHDTGSLSKRVHTWTGEAFTSLYEYPLNNSESNNEVKRIKGEVKSKLNESTAVLTPDGQTMYFTRNNILDGTRKYDAGKNTRLKIYRAELKDGKWVNVAELPFNSDDFSTAHPALSPDGRTLYFSSDRPGGFGESDLWSVSVNGTTYGMPQNLGADINTEARETFPYMSSNNELYFSSDGRVGLGGLDVYVANQNDNGLFEPVQNVGEPINSNADDFAYYIDYQTKEGFFSSNRDGGNGNDDIYSFVETRMIQPPCEQDLRVIVIDGKTKTRLNDATVTLYDAYYKMQDAAKTAQADGYRFNAEYECGATYRLKVGKDQYVTVEEPVTLANESGTTEKTILLYPRKVEVKKNDDLFKVLKLNPIYFDLDKHNIRPDAAVELAKIAEVLKEYPQMKIDVRSHTDSRASDSYNLKLSQRRAKATAEWLVAQGIDAGRITYKGYGETQLENGCKNGVKCSEEQHQENRRSEFLVMEM